MGTTVFLTKAATCSSEIFCPWGILAVSSSEDFLSSAFPLVQTSLARARYSSLVGGLPPPQPPVVRASPTTTTAAIAASRIVTVRRTPPPPSAGGNASAASPATVASPQKPPETE